jgi:hypothetical protein
MERDTTPKTALPTLTSPIDDPHEAVVRGAGGDIVSHRGADFYLEVQIKLG